MTSWPKHPTIYEINAWVWLHELSKRYKQSLTLATVPAQEWDALAEYGFDVVWLMGVWERSPEGANIAWEHQGLRQDYAIALPDYRRKDVVGSPYAIHRYEVDAHLGGPAGLAAARTALAERGMSLLLDFVPNHVAIDHPWTTEHPAYFIQGSADDLAQAPEYFFKVDEQIYANGRDPYFPAWTDTAQLNAFSADLRQATIRTLKTIAQQSDGVRCDMAMLQVTRIFMQTWGDRAGQPPVTEFWREVINAVRQEYPDFHFIAEAYWDMEWELQQQGFDFCYDKCLYDRLRDSTPERICQHLTADMDYQNKLVRFIENHDEPRAALSFSQPQQRAAAVTIATLPGARLFHAGQFEGYQFRLPVQLSRRQQEPINSDLRAFYRTLLAEINEPIFKNGEWTLCDIYGWPDNPSAMNLIAWYWRLGNERRLIVVNLSEYPSQAHIRLPWDDLGGREWRLSDIFSGEIYARAGDEIASRGLYVGIPPYGLHFLRFE